MKQAFLRIRLQSAQRMERMPHGTFRRSVGDGIRKRQDRQEAMQSRSIPTQKSQPALYQNRHGCGARLQVPLPDKFPVLRHMRGRKKKMRLLREQAALFLRVCRQGCPFEMIKKCIGHMAAAPLQDSCGNRLSKNPSPAVVRNMSWRTLANPWRETLPSSRFTRKSASTRMR